VGSGDVWLGRQINENFLADLREIDGPSNPTPREKTYRVFTSPRVAGHREGKPGYLF